MKLRTILLSIAIALAIPCIHADNLNLIPRPAEISMTRNTVPLKKVLTISTEMPESDRAALMEYLRDYPIETNPVKKNGFIRARVITGSMDSDEAYIMDIRKNGIEIKTSAPAGIFYGLQTLAQLVRNGKLHEGTITDSPRFPYRGLHLDVSRHFFTPEHVKRQIDLISTYKMNRLHLHLTDGVGWRLEIPGYPRLTDYAAWRRSSDLDSLAKFDEKFCTRDTEGAYGGYYTADDIRDILDYARLRHVTVIPEIEMPGHSEEVLAAYPELSCTGEPTGAGEVCIGNEATFKFFEDVLDEVIRLFPSHYIHIGGDEASRQHWKNCPKCQKRIKDEGLGDEDGLQSYIIRRIEKYVNSKGRDIIGWDEIIDGGVAPNATIMCWRSPDGAIKAAEEGHDVIMTPGSNYYLDAPQADPETQPRAFGPTVTIGRTYSYNPVPASASAKAAKHIIGVQGNTWAEQIPTPQHAEYMIYPRIIAIAETGWTPQERKDSVDFMRRINSEVKHLKAIGYNPFMLSERVQVAQDVDRENERILVTLTSERMPSEIRYTTDGSEPTAESALYTAPIAVKDSIFLATRIFENGKPLGDVVRMRTDYHKAIGKKVTYLPKGHYYMHNEVYKGGGDTALTDGRRGGKTYVDGRWQGFCPGDMDVVIDLGETMPVHRIMANFMQMRTPSVFLPEKVEIWTSINGSDYTLIKSETPSEEETAPDVIFRDFGWTGTPIEARYIRFHAMQDHRGFLFTDEIVVQ